MTFLDSVEKTKEGKMWMNTELNVPTRHTEERKITAEKSFDFFPFMPCPATRGSITKQRSPVKQFSDVLVEQFFAYSTQNVSQCAHGPVLQTANGTHYCKYIKKFNMSIDFRQWLFTLCLVFKQNEYVLSSRENPSLKTHEACVCSTENTKGCTSIPLSSTSQHRKKYLKITNAKVPDQRTPHNTQTAVQEIKWI